MGPEPAAIRQYSRPDKNQNMRPPDLVLELQRADIGIQLSGDDLEISCRSATGLSDDWMTKLLLHKKELIEWLQAAQRQSVVDPVPASGRMEYYPASPAQQRIWMIQQLGTTHAYNMFASGRIIGDCDPELFAKAWNSLVQRHEILRTTFMVQNGDLVQKVTAPPAADAALFADCSRLRENETYVRELIDGLLSTRFNLAKGPLHRLRLLRTRPNEYIFVLVLHHIIADGLSMEILSREMMLLYSAFLTGATATLPPTRIQYRDYAVWIRHRQATAGNADLSYWERKLAGVLPVLNLPYDFNRPAFRSFAGSEYEFSIDGSNRSSLLALAGKEQITLASLLLSIFKLLLFKLSGQQDLIVGVAASGRDHPDLDNLVGLFVNTLAIRTSPDNDISIRQYLHQVHRLLQEALGHQAVPFDQVVDSLTVVRDASRNPVFDVLYNFTDRSQPEITKEETFPVIPLELKRDTSRFDLVLDATVRNERIDLRIEFDTALFKQETIRRFLGYLDEIICACIANPDRQLRSLKSLPLHAGPDIVAVKHPDSDPSYESLYAEPAEGPERLLAGIWKKVLDLEEIGIHDNFFAQGGDSMKVIRMVSEFNRLSATNLQVKDAYLHQTIAKLAAYAAHKGTHEDRKQMLAQITREMAGWKDRVRTSSAYAHGGVEDAYPMSEIEKGLIFHNYLDHADAIYHNQYFLRIKDEAFDCTLFFKALTLLIEKHETLRTSYNLVGFSEPLHIVHYPTALQPSLAHTDIGHLQPEEQRSYIEALMDADKKDPFDINKAGLWRMKVLGLSGGYHGILWIFHHAILDGWSIMSLFAELTNTYHRLCLDGSSQVRPLQSSYRDYVAAELAVRNSAPHREFWKEYLDGYERTPIPFAKPGEKVPRFDTYNIHLDQRLRRQLYDLAASEETGIKEVLLSAFLYLLKLTTGAASDIVIGLVSHTRPALPDGDRILGCFLNSVPFRFAVPDRVSVRKLLRRVRDDLATLKKYDASPLTEIVKATGHTAGNNPIFDVAFNYIDFHILKEANTAMQPEKSDIQSNAFTNTLFDFHVHNTGDSTILHFKFSQCYTQSEIQLWTGYFLKVLESMANGDMLDPGKIAAGHSDYLLHELNHTAAPWPEGKSLIDLWGQQLKACPHSIAAVEEDRCFSRLEIDRRANRLAEHLVFDHGILPGDHIALILTPGVEMVITLLAILKAGAAYIPIDPDAPQQRALFMIEDAGARVVLVSQEHTLLKATTGQAPKATTGQARYFDIPSADDDFWQSGTGIPLPSPAPASLAYAIYTSGSTGVPKGVMIDHEAVVARIDWLWKAYRFHPGDRFLQKTPYYFDVSVFELWLPMCCGCEMVLAPGEARYDPRLILRYLSKHAVTAVNFVPGVYSAFLDVLQDRRNARGLGALNQVFASGEALLPSVAQRHHQLLSAALINLYGPTETTVDVTWYNTSPGETSMPIGKPVSNVQLYILNGKADLMPPHCIGEIGIGGAGLARGYINDPEKTADRFINNPFDPGRKLYRTGDLGRWLLDGNMEYLGRKDHQVKIRGHRIELGEIENILLGLEDIEEAAVVVRTDKLGSDQLVAFIVSPLELSASTLRSYLTGRLPGYMIPSWFFQLDSMPKTASGKVDRKALPSPPQEPPSAGAGTPEELANETERLLAAIWSKTLGREKIGMNENFFEIGGDSIKAIQVVSRIAQEGYQLDTKTLFRFPFVRQLAPLLKQASVSIDQSAVTGPVPLTPIQSFYFSLARKYPHHFNHAVMLRLTNRHASSDLLRIFGKIQQHHDQLRAIYRRTKESWEQEIMDTDWPVAFQTIDCSRETSLSLDQMTDAIQGSLQLEKAPLLQIAHFVWPEYDTLLIVVHHLNMDGISWRILFEDLETLIHQAGAGKPLRLPMKTHSFRDYALAIRASAIQRTFDPQAKYWRQMEQQVAGANLIPSLPGSHSAMTRETEMVSAELDETRSRLLLNAANKPYMTETQDLLLAALAMALQDCFGLDRFAFMMESHGRDGIPGELNISRTVGWFTTLFPLVLSLEHTRDIGRFIREVKQSLRTVPNKGMGYGLLNFPPSDNLAAPRTPSMLFNYLGQFDQDISTATFTVAAESPGKPVANDDIPIFDLEFTGIFIDHRLHISLAFGKHQYSGNNMKMLLNNCIHQLETLIDHCSTTGTVQYTPSDYGNIEFSIDELDQIFS